jgi:hypothetical protein
MKHILFGILTALSLSSPAARAEDCLSLHSPTQVDSRLTQAEQALKALDAEAFSLAMEDAAIMLPCLGAVPPRALAARLHRLRGIELYSAGKEDSARQALRAAKVLEPDFGFAEDLFPQGHALPDFWAELPVEQPQDIGAPVPQDATVHFDGARSLKRPTDRATLFQHLSRQGRVRTTRYLMPSDPLPLYASIPRQRNRLIAVSIVTGLAAGGTYALAWQNRQRFMEDDASRTKAELSTLKSRVNSQFLISGISASLTVTGITAAVLIGPR